MRHILTLTDFSPRAEKAVATAFGLAAKHDAEITILHSLESREYTSIHLTGDQPLDGSTPYLSWKAQAEALGVKAYYSICAGYLPDVVHEIAEEINADLIVLGTTGRGDSNDKYWGSNAENITKESDTPLLAVKEIPPSPDPTTIVFASSFDTAELATLRRALNLLAPRENAVVHLLSVDTLKAFAQPAPVVKAAMQDFANAISPIASEIHFYSDMSIESGIKHFAEEISPDVIIMAHRHHKSIKHFLQGNDTIRTLNKVDYPILVIPT